jgi:hypothetical protein
MKGKIFIVVILILFTSCEKGVTEDDTILKFFSEAYEDTGNSIAIGDDGYYICGQLVDSINGINPMKKVGVLKAGFDGNLIGEMKTFGTTEGSASKIIVLEDGTVLCTGYVLDVASQKDIIVLHLNSDLSEIAPPKIYPGTGNQYGVDILETQEGFLVLATTDVKREPVGEVTGNAAGKKDILLMRIGANLEPLAEIPAVGFIGNDEGVAVKADLNGGFTVIGTTDRSDRPSSEQSGNNIILVRLNSVGNTTQPRIMGGTKNEAASDFEVLNDGYLIAGTVGNAGIDQQGYIWKMPLDIYNNPEYEHVIDIEPAEATKTPYIIKAMCRYKSNSFLLAGQFDKGLSARQLIFSIDASGAPVEGRKKITKGTGTQITNDVVSDESGNIITVGNNSYESNSMICFLKFRF